MQINPEELQVILDQVGAVFSARATEISLGEASQDSDLITAQEATTEALSGLKLLVAAKIQSAGITIVQEGDASRPEGPYVMMPASVSCEC